MPNTFISNCKTKRPAKRFFAFVLVLCFLFSAIPFAGSQGPETNRSHTTLLLHVDETEHRLLSLMLIADNPASGQIAFLPIPTNTRTIVDVYENPSTAWSEYTRIYAAYHANCPDPAANTARSVSALLGGISIDSIITFDSDALGTLVEAAGGIGMPISELPSSGWMQESDSAYPFYDSMSALAQYIKKAQRIENAVPEYDMDIGQLLHNGDPAKAMAQLPKSLLLNAEEAVSLWNYSIFPEGSGTDIMQLHRQQLMLLNMLTSCMIGREKCFDDFAATTEGEPSFFSRLKAYTTMQLPETGIVPAGADHELTEETQWVFDTVWLRQWVLTNIYDQ